MLGAQSGTKACRYERFARVPSLETALAYEAIFKTSVSELFGGLYQKVEREVAERAKILAEKSGGDMPGPETARKRQVLAELAA